MNPILLAALLLIQSPNGTITGRLMSAPGVPAIGVRITAKPVVDAAVPASPDVLLSISQTDSAGRYRLENIPPGRYFITAGLVGSPTYFPGTATIGDATAFNITAGSTASVPDFTLLQSSVPPVVSAAQDPRYKRLPKLADPVALSVVQDARSAFEALGELAGVRVVFDRRFVPGVPAPFVAQGVSVLGALNLLAAQTGSDWAIAGRDTIIVVPTSQGLKDLDLQLPPRDLAVAAVYPGFRPKLAGPLSFDIKGQSIAAFETIASTSGLTVVFDRDFRGLASQLKVDNADIYSALDILSAQAGAFWVPYDSSTIFVSLDTVTKHRDYDLRVVKMYYLTNLKTTQEFNNAGAAMRKTLSLSMHIPIPAANAILVIDTPSAVAFADKMIAELDKTQAVRAVTEVMDAAGNLFVVEPAGLRNVTPYRSELQARPGRYSMDINLPARQAFEKIAESGGIRVVFDTNLSTFIPSQVQLKLNDVDFFKALDLLSLQTRTFWIPLDGKTVFVASDLSTTRRDYEPQFVKTFYPSVTTAQELNNTMNVVRQSITVTNAVSSPHAKAITIRDNPLKIALAEMLIAQMDKSGGRNVPSSAELETTTVSNTFLREFSGRHTMSPARSQLQPDVAGPVSLRVNGTSRDAYETLSRTAGIQVTFDSRFVPGNTGSFQIDTASVFDALSILSYQTKTFWRVVDSKTIQVAPALYSVRNELEPKIEKSIPLTNVRLPEDVSNIVNSVRQVLNFQSSIAPNAAMTAIDMTETAEKVAVAEALIKSLDVP